MQWTQTIYWNILQKQQMQSIGLNWIRFIFSFPFRCCISMISMVPTTILIFHLIFDKGNQFYFIWIKLKSMKYEINLLIDILLVWWMESQLIIINNSERVRLWVWFVSITHYGFIVVFFALSVSPVLFCSKKFKNSSFLLSFYFIYILLFYINPF